MKYMIKLALSFLLERLVEVRFKCITCVSQLKKEKRKRKEKEILNDSKRAKFTWMVTLFR